MANELAFTPPREVQLPAERMAVLIVANVLLIATAARPAMSLTRAAPAARVVVARIEADRA